MQPRRRSSVFLDLALVGVLVTTALGQSALKPPPESSVSASHDSSATASKPVPPISPNAPHISKQTRLELIRDFETQLVYSRTLFPMGSKGLKLKDGVTTPNGEDLRHAMALYGPALKPGDPAHITYVRIKDDYMRFEINGGPVRRKKWYQRIEVAGANGVPVNPGGGGEEITNPHGSYLDLYFDKYVPEMTAAQLRKLLYPALDFTAHTKQEAYLNTVPPIVKQAILAHHVLVGMDTDMVLAAKGKPPKKVREKEGESEYEEWIYGDPPQDVDFVRIVGGEVVRVETMKVGGQKIVRTAKEVNLERPEKETEAKKEEERPVKAPSLRRPGESPQDVPEPADGPSPIGPMPPPDVPAPPGSPGGPGTIPQ